MYQSTSNVLLDLPQTWCLDHRLLSTFNGKRQPRFLTAGAGISLNYSTTSIKLYFDINLRLISPISIKQQKFSAVFDTGATHSCIRYDLLMSLNISVDATSIHTLQLADTTNIPVYGCANLWFILDGIVFNHTFLVLTTCLDDIIIGANFFNQARLNLVIGPAQRPISYKQSVVLNSVRLEKEKVEEEVIVKKFLDAELPRFDTLKGTSNIAQHSITMKHDRPLKQRYSPKNPAVQNLINIEVDNLLEDQRIEPSKSPYSSPVVLVKKTNGEWRLCVDYRQINEHSVRDAYPLPKINYILEKLRNGTYFSTIDFRQGYWQIPMAEQSKHLTAFTVPGRGLFQFKVMPFGLHSAPVTFQRALD